MIPFFGAPPRAFGMRVVDSTRCGHTSRVGFTLLELTVVIALIAAISMSIMPVYVSSMNGIQLRNARNDILSVIRYAQEMAVRESREYRVYFNEKENSYRLTRLTGLEDDEKVFESAESLLGEQQRLPDYLVIERVQGLRDRKTREYYVSCLPNGASNQTTIRLRDTRVRGSRYEVEVLGPMGKVTVKERR